MNFVSRAPLTGLPLRTLGNVVRAPEVLPFPVVCSSGSFWNIRRLCHGNTIRVISFRCDLGTLSSPWQLSES